MPIVYIAIFVVALLITLACYAFVTQTIEQKRKQKQRLLSVLKTRLRNFNYILSGFPSDFLPKDLVVLVYRCLADVLEQLVQLEPKERAYLEELELCNAQMREAQQKPPSGKPLPLQNPQQIKDVRQHLQELNKFIHLLEKRGTLSPSDAEIYRRQLKQLVLQISVDAYIMHAKEAQQNEKKRLAVHYYGLARKLLIRENLDGRHQKQLVQLNAIIGGLETKIAEEEPTYRESDEQLAEKAAVEEAWETFSKGDESWKKKNLYD